MVEAGGLLTKLRERNAVWSWRDIQNLAEDLDDNVLRAAGLTSKDEPALFDLVQKLEDFVASGKAKKLKRRTIFESKELPFIPNLKEALKKGVEDLINKNKGKNAPAHAQADEVTFAVPAPKPTPIETVDLTGSPKARPARPRTPPPPRSGTPVMDLTAGTDSDDEAAMQEFKEAVKQQQLPRRGSKAQMLETRRRKAAEERARAAEDEDYGMHTPAYEQDMFDPTEYGAQDWKYRSRSRSEFEMGFHRGWGKPREPAYALGLHTGHKAGPRVAAAMEEAGSYLDIKASFKNIWKNVKKFAKERPESTKAFVEAGFKFLPTSSGILKGPVGLLDHLNKPYAFRGRRYGSGATDGPLYQLYKELVTNGASHRKPPTFESLLKYTRPNVADRTEAFFSTKSKPKGLGHLSKLTEGQREAIRQLLDPVHGFNNELQDDEGRWLGGLVSRANHRYENTTRKPMKEIIRLVGNKEERKFIEEYPKQGATAADHNRLHRICLRLTKTYGKLFAHLDKSTSDETVDQGSRAERGLAKFEEWSHYKTHTDAPDREVLAERKRKRLAAQTAKGRQKRDRHRREQKKLISAENNKRADHEADTMLHRVGRTKGKHDQTGSSEELGFKILNDELGNFVSSRGDVYTLQSLVRSSIIPSDITVRKMNSFVGGELIQQYLKPIVQSLGNVWLGKHFPQSAQLAVQSPVGLHTFTLRDAYELAKSGKVNVPKPKEFVGVVDAILAVFGGTPKILEGRNKQLEFDERAFWDMEWASAFEPVFSYDDAQGAYVPPQPRQRADSEPDEDEKKEEPKRQGKTIVAGGWGQVLKKKKDPKRPPPRHMAADVLSRSPSASWAGRQSEAKVLKYRPDPKPTPYKKPELAYVPAVARPRARSLSRLATDLPSREELAAQGRTDLELGTIDVMAGRGRRGSSAKRGRSASIGVMPPMMAPAVRDRKMLHTMRTSLIAQPSAMTVTDHTSYNHMIEGDLAPVGRVHLVSLGPDVGDENENHILTQLDADANMGAQNLRQRARRGPFRTSTGRSRIMDRSAHVSYRRRGYTIEITIRRGVTENEMDVLISKLCAHRMSSQEATVFLINGTRKKMGTLDRIDMEKLRLKIEKELTKRATIGILIQDNVSKGLLHKGYSYSMDFSNGMKDMLGSALFAR